MSSIQEIARDILSILDKANEFLAFKKIQEELMEKLNPKDKNRIMLTIPTCLRILSSQEYVLRRYQSEIAKDEFKISEKGKKLLNSKKRTSEKEKMFKPHGVSLVITKPPFLFSSFPNLRQTLNTFSEIIETSNKKLWILSPYIDKNLLTMFLEKFRNTFKKVNLDFRLIISHINRYSVMAVDFLQQIAASSGREKIPVRVFYEKTIFRENNSRKVARTKFSHAKIYLSDDLALITSANMNSESFVSNVEIGVLFRGDKEILKVLSDIFQVIWDNSNSFDDYVK